LDDILTEVIIVVSQSGRLYEKDEILDLIPSIPKGSFDVDDFQVCELGEEYALNGYRMVRANDSGKTPKCPIVVRFDVEDLTGGE
jgi:hypothetical protein